MASPHTITALPHTITASCHSVHLHDILKCTGINEVFQEVYVEIKIIKAYIRAYSNVKYMVGLLSRKAFMAFMICLEKFHILIFKNQVLQIIYLKHHLYKTL